MSPGMGMGMQMQPAMKQQLILAPRMIQSMEILQLPIMALQERIQQELLENPVLEQREAKEEIAGEEPGSDFIEQPSDANDPVKELVIETNGDGEEDFERLEKINQDWLDHFNEEHRPSSNRQDEEGDKKHDFEQNMPSRPQSLQDYLTDQLPFLDYAPDVERLMRHIISNITDIGWLGRISEKNLFHVISMEELAAAYDLPITQEQLLHALSLVQKLDPPGVGARDLNECLLLQVTAETPHRETVRILIRNHLEDITHNRLPLIQKRTGLDMRTIGEAMEVLKHLNPRPARSSRPRTLPTSCRTSSWNAPTRATTAFACSTTGCPTSTSASAGSSSTRTDARTPRLAST